MECQAVRAEHLRSHRGSRSSAAAAAAADVLLAETQALQESLGGDPSTMSSCLRVLHDEVRPKGEERTKDGEGE